MSGYNSRESRNRLPQIAVDDDGFSWRSKDIGRINAKGHDLLFANDANGDWLSPVEVYEQTLELTQWMLAVTPEGIGLGAAGPMNLRTRRSMDGKEMPLDLIQAFEHAREHGRLHALEHFHCEGHLTDDEAIRMTGGVMPEQALVQYEEHLREWVMERQIAFYQRQFDERVMAGELPAIVVVEDKDGGVHVGMAAVMVNALTVSSTQLAPAAKKDQQGRRFKGTKMILKIGAGFGISAIAVSACMPVGEAPTPVVTQADLTETNQDSGVEPVGTEGVVVETTDAGTVVETEEVATPMPNVVESSGDRVGEYPTTSEGFKLNEGGPIAATREAIQNFLIELGEVKEGVTDLDDMEASLIITVWRQFPEYFGNMTYDEVFAEVLGGNGEFSMYHVLNQGEDGRGSWAVMLYHKQTGAFMQPVRNNDGYQYPELMPVGARLDEYHFEPRSGSKPGGKAVLVGDRSLNNLMAWVDSEGKLMEWYSVISRGLVEESQLPDLASVPAEFGVVGVADIEGGTYGLNELGWATAKYVNGEWVKYEREVYVMARTQEIVNAIPTNMLSELSPNEVRRIQVTEQTSNDVLFGISTIPEQMQLEGSISSDIDGNLDYGLVWVAKLAPLDVNIETVPRHALISGHVLGVFQSPNQFGYVESYLLFEEPHPLRRRLLTVQIPDQDNTFVNARSMSLERKLLDLKVASWPDNGLALWWSDWIGIFTRARGEQIILGIQENLDISGAQSGFTNFIDQMKTGGSRSISGEQWSIVPSFWIVPTEIIQR